MNRATTEGRPRLWTAAVLAASMPFLLVLCVTLWRMPYPLSEAVGLFEDVDDRPLSDFLIPTTSYYRPLFYAALAALWHGSGSIDAALSAIKLLHIVPVILLVVALIWQLRPRSAFDAAAAAFAVTVLAGSPGLLGNLELPLSYTIVGMPCALLVWMLLERDGRPWRGAAILVLTVVAIGFKEQGLAIVPAVIVARWMRAPGASRATAALAGGIAVAYVGLRLAYHDPSLPMFEQDVGLGFRSMSPIEAEARFGAFPLGIYAYNSASTIGNVLFAEPTEGVFRIVRAFAHARPQPWHFVHVLSSTVLTAAIAWWGWSALVRSSPAPAGERRLFVATIAVVIACGALSFNYSRDRLGGMAAVFYAMAGYYAIRHTMARAARASRAAATVTALAMLLLAAGWQLRALYTIEFTRQRAVNSHREWITDLRERRAEFATRSTYLAIMEAMIEQGVVSPAVRPIRYPLWLRHAAGEY